MQYRMYDLIALKRDGRPLSGEMLRYIARGSADGSIPDYQLSALLMAIYLRGMDEEETALFTKAIADSGDRIDLSGIGGVKVDKHSTGGVGDKTTLIIGPLVAACGIKVAKMSGRGLGHTGGTIDKLEAIPGLSTSLSEAEFKQQVERIGIAITGQTGDLAPADKRLYALRDVTATVGSIPLIASSVMSKKLAAGNDAILLDVKTGSGALLNSFEDSLALAKAMVKIGEHNGKPTAAFVTSMDTPLGNAVGNGMEVAEAVRVLRGGAPDDLRHICLELAAAMLQLGGLGNRASCLMLAEEALVSGRALQKLRDLVEAQGGDPAYIDAPGSLFETKVTQEAMASQAGYITKMDTAKIGAAAVVLGAGRQEKDDVIDPSAGIILRAKTGDRVEAGGTLALVKCADPTRAHHAVQLFLEAVEIGDAPPPKQPLILARVSQRGVEHLAQ